MWVADGLSAISFAIFSIYLGKQNLNHIGFIALLRKRIKGLACDDNFNFDGGEAFCVYSNINNQQCTRCFNKIAVLSQYFSLNNLE